NNTTLNTQVDSWKKEIPFGVARGPTIPALAPSPVSTEVNPIIALGDRCYRVGQSEPLRVEDREDAVLQGFLRSPAMSKPKLASVIGYEAETVIAILRALKGTPRRPAKYSGVFAAAITLPGGRGKGGYRVKIVKG